MHDSHHYATFLLYCLLLLFERHWMIGLTNLGLTAALGLGLLRVAQSWHFLQLSPQVILRARRSVLLVALFKGALYLIMGESMQTSPNNPWIIGVQFPSPDETAGLLAQTGYSIWHPTEASRWVCLVLSALATIFLLLRAVQITLAKRAYRLWLGLSASPGSERTGLLLARAAKGLDLPPGALLPEILEIDPPSGSQRCQTPLLLGVRRPLLLLPAYLLEALTEDELDMVLRHELAHFVRRDHWGRWLLLWMTDIAGLTFLAFFLKAAIIEIEEQLCDRRAVQSPDEAVVLAQALQVVAGLVSNGKWHSEVSERRGLGETSDEPAATVPADASQRAPSIWGSLPLGPPPRLALHKLFPVSAILLLGGYAASWHAPGALSGRLKGLLDYSQDLSVPRHDKPHVRLGVSSRELPQDQLPSLPRIPFSSIAWLGSFIVRPIIRLGIVGCRYFMALVLFLFLFLILYAKFHLTPNLHFTPNLP